MKHTYEQNPALGDPHSVDSQLSENEQKMQKLHQELKKFEGYLNEVYSIMDNKPSTPQNLQRQGISHSTSHQHNATNGIGHRNSVAESESLSRSASDSSVGPPPPSQNAPATPAQSHLHPNGKTLGVPNGSTASSASGSTSDARPAPTPITITNPMVNSSFKVPDSIQISAPTTTPNNQSKGSPSLPSSIQNGIRRGGDSQNDNN